ncbi:MAG: hypothetical protein JXX14_11415 [Deltaproteobacteria bacterium]|nr:hypothetical protein [Deltaproteobacteria bacterium]
MTKRYSIQLSATPLPYRSSTAPRALAFVHHGWGVDCGVDSLCRIALG